MTATITKAALQLMRIKLCQACQLKMVHTAGTPLYFQATAVVNGMPPKKKSKVQSISPAIINRKKRRIEKEIRSLSKGEVILKPIDELEILPKFRREIESGLRKRQRPVMTSEELEEQVLLEKDWSRYKMKEHHVELAATHRAMVSQNRALAKLREESEELYQQAIQLDDELSHYRFSGPTETPPINKYETLDGDYNDVTNYFILKNKK